MYIFYFRNLKIAILSLIVLMTVFLFSSCGKKEPNRTEEYTPENLELHYNSGRPVITWQTAQPTEGSVFYGTNPGEYKHFAYETGQSSKIHSLQLIAADSGMSYFYMVRSSVNGSVASVSTEKKFVPQAHDHRAIFEWTMLNISQNIANGDCHYIQTPNGYRVVIDSGNDDKVNTFFDFCNRRNLDHFDLAIITHIHYDHYGGFTNGIFETYRFDSLKLAASNIPDYDGVYSNIYSLAQSEQIGLARVEEGDYLHWDPSLTVLVLHSGQIGDGNENNSSIVLKITYGQVDFILTGDSEIPSENIMIDNLSGYELDCDVLKIGHHGRYDANGDDWFSITKPIAALIPVDQQSSYGGNSLPSESVIENLRDRGIDIYRSDKNYPNSSSYSHSNITVLSDGQIFEISIN
ncbi:MAG: MBL fold metallo-hydrolase [candidate division Zixibacteria bacterium]|nr:MBL fold metallo-hydrolase [candidate division Zixibacteria bacterium]